MIRLTCSNLLSICAALVVAAGLSSCASVSVEKIPTPTQYSEWNDARQEKADKIQGFRYYLPRPFVAVNQEFPIESTTRIVPGTLSADGLATINPNDLPEDWRAAVTANQAAGTPAMVPRSTNDQNGGPNMADIYGSTDKPTAFPLASAVVVSGQTIAVGGIAGTGQIVGHLGTAGTKIGFTLTVSKSALSTKDCKVGTIHKLLLLTTDGTKVAETGYELPMALYAEGPETGTFKLNGFLPKTVSAGNYVFGVQYQKDDGPGLKEYLAYNPAGVAQLIVDDGWGADEPNLGTADQATVVAAQMIPGFTFSRVGGGSIAGSDDKADLGATFKASGLKLASGDALPGIGGTGGGVVTGVGLAPAKGGAPDLTKAVRLPFTGGKDKDTDAVVDFYGTINYTKANSKSLELGNHYAVAWITVNDQPLGIRTIPVYSQYTVLRVDPPRVSAGSTATVGSGTGTGTGSTNTNSNPTAQKTDEDNGKEVGSEQGKSDVPAGESRAIMASNSATKPIMRVNDLLSIVYMPDFDEQYAVQAHGRLGKASMEVTLAQGWLMEKGASSVDNKAIAQFIFDQVGKTLDLARDLVRVDQGLLAKITSPAPVADTGAAAGATTSAAQSIIQGATAPRAVTYRVHRRKLAVPGLYPVLKPRELYAAVEADIVESTKSDNQANSTTPAKPAIRKSGWQRLLLDPSPMIKFTLREEIVVELVRFDEKPAAPAGGADPVEIKKKVLAALAGDEFKKFSFNVPPITGKSVKVTVAPVAVNDPAPTEEDIIKIQAALDKAKATLGLPAGADIKVMPE